jgi:hypothetical protein
MWAMYKRIALISATVAQWHSPCATGLFITMRSGEPIHNSDERGDLAASTDCLGRVASVLEGILIAPWCSRRHPTV